MRCVPKFSPPRLVHRCTVLLTAIFLLVSGSPAGIISSQTPGGAGAGFLSARWTVNGSAYDEFVWDEFTPSTTQTVREIQWFGSGGGPVDFEITVSTSVYVPNGTVWHTNGSASEIPTGTPGVYAYRYTLPAGFVVTGGQTYALRIVATQDAWPTWHWSAGTGGNGTHYAQVPAVTGDYRFVVNSGDTAFSILNAATVPVTIAVNSLPAAGGTDTGGGTFAPGTSVTVTASPASGRTFLNWTEAGVVVSTSASFTFAADGNKTLSANFSGPNTGPYVISAVPNPAVNGNVGGAGTFNAGEVVDLDVTAADGVSFVGWTENGEIVSLPYSGGVFQVTASADRNLVANFAYPAYTSYINGVVSPAGSGSIVIAGTAGLSGGSYYGGTPITLNATPSSGYHFAYWKQGAGLGDLSGPPHVVGTNPALKHMVCYGTSLTAYFEPNFPFLTAGVSPAAGGTVTGTGTYAHGSTVTVDANPAVGYTFQHWKQGNTVLSTSSSYTFLLTNHTALTAVFVATNRTITASALPAEGGNVTGAGVVGNGATVTLTASAAPGFTFTRWTLAGADAGGMNPITFNATANYAFVANFTAQPTFLVEATPLPAEGGTVVGAGSYTSGSAVALTALPNAGYYFLAWTEAGTPVSTNPSYEFPSGSNRTLVAHFAPGYTCTAAPSFAPGGSVSGAGGFATDVLVTLVAAPTPGYQFLGWSENGQIVNESATYTFPAAANRDLVALFAPILAIDATTPDSVSFRWPDSAVGWVLQESLDLAATAWTDSALPITSSNGLNQTTVSIPGGKRFLRLVFP